MSVTYKRAFVAGYSDCFFARLETAHNALTSGMFEVEVHYAQSTQIDGRVLFSALLIGKQTEA
jgi:hypothetical protein